MVPMPPMVFRRACPFERIGGGAPVAGWRLRGESEAGSASAIELCKPGGQELTASTLRVEYLLYVVMQLVRRVGLPCGSPTRLKTVRQLPVVADPAASSLSPVRLDRGNRGHTKDREPTDPIE